MSDYTVFDITYLLILYNTEYEKIKQRKQKE